ncbi:DUF5059 domain-containing protein, partial [Haloferax volcanii]
MEYSRRRLLQTTGIAVATAGLAGCNGQSSDETTTAAETDSETETAAETTTENAESSVSVDAAVAVAAEWNAMRARLYDTVALAARKQGTRFKAEVPRNDAVV